jgi:hypothetical protein
MSCPSVLEGLLRWATTEWVSAPVWRQEAPLCSGRWGWKRTIRRWWIGDQEPEARSTEVGKPAA